MLVEQLVMRKLLCTVHTLNWWVWFPGIEMQISTTILTKINVHAPPVNIWINVNC